MITTGEGEDTVVFEGSSENYTVERGDSVNAPEGTVEPFKITNNETGEVTYVSGAENFQFDDGTYTSTEMNEKAGYTGNQQGFVNPLEGQTPAQQRTTVSQMSNDDLESTKQGLEDEVAEQQAIVNDDTGAYTEEEKAEAQAKLGGEWGLNAQLGRVTDEQARRDNDYSYSSVTEGQNFDVGNHDSEDPTHRVVTGTDSAEDTVVFEGDISDYNISRGGGPEGGEGDYFRVTHNETGEVTYVTSVENFKFGGDEGEAVPHTDLNTIAEYGAYNSEDTENDNVTYETSDDEYNAEAGDDIVYVDPGSKGEIRGGDGTDKVVFEGSRDDYTISREQNEDGSSGAYVVTDADGNTTYLRGFEYFTFKDDTYSSDEMYDEYVTVPGEA